MIGLLKRQIAPRKPFATTAAVNSARPASTEYKSTQITLAPIKALSTASDTRLLLAERLVTMLPRLTEEKQTQLYAYTVQALGSIALEEVLKIRQTFASTLRDHAYIPPKMAADLSRMLEREISEPILKLCAGISNNDLIEILRKHPAPWVDRMIIEKNSENSALTEYLQKIVVKSRELNKSQVPLPRNLSIPSSINSELSEIIDASMRELLLSQGFDLRTTEDVTAVFRRRLNLVNGIITSEIQYLSINEKITDALALRNTDYVFMTIARILNVTLDSIIQIFETKSARSIVALSWKAGLSMRTALALQRDLALVSTQKLIYPRDGENYPLTEQELRWQLDFLGL